MACSSLCVACHFTPCGEEDPWSSLSQAGVIGLHLVFLCVVRVRLMPRRISHVQSWKSYGICCGTLPTLFIDLVMSLLASVDIFLQALCFSVSDVFFSNPSHTVTVGLA